MLVPCATAADASVPCGTAADASRQLALALGVMMLVNGMKLPSHAMKLLAWFPMAVAVVKFTQTFT